jgi:Zn-dependent protease
MGRSTFRVGRILGIPIGIHPLWLVIVGVITWSLGSTYFPDADPALSETAAYALGLLSALGLFAGILLHELGHAVVARRHGIEVEEIDLWLLGGVSRLEGEAKQPGDELRFAAAGPAVTAVIVALLAIILVAIGGQLPLWGRALLDYALFINVAILVFNLLPAFPLDGGRIARSLMWRHHGDRDRATATAGRLGRAFGWGFVALGALAFLEGLIDGLFLALVGGFLIIAGGAEARASEVAHALGDRTAADLMSTPAVSLPATLTVADAIELGFARYLFSAFPVTDPAGRAIGIVTLRDVQAMPAPQRAITTLGALAHRDPELRVEPSHSAFAVLADPVFRRVGRAVVIDSAGRPIGLVSITDIERRLRAEGLLPRGDGPRRAA